jgi:hypothetical protein
MSNFIEQCLSRQSSLEDIDDFIDQWHENPGNQSLHEFLGMTRDEYANWVADSSALPAIVKARKYSGNSAPSVSPGGPGA